MLNIHPNAFQFVELEMLTRLDVITSQSTVLNHRLGEMVIRPEAWRGWTVLSTRPLWNNLESINLVIDSEELAECDGTMIDTDGNARFARYYTIPIGYLFRFLFHEQSTESLTQLTIKFEYITGWKLSLEVVQDIVTSCPNIKKLGLTNWPATNKCLTKFWEGLSELEEVTLECCKSLGNVAFVGTDIENPVFLRSASKPIKIYMLAFYIFGLIHLHLFFVWNRIENSFIVGLGPNAENLGHFIQIGS